MKNWRAVTAQERRPRESNKRITGVMILALICLSCLVNTSSGQWGDRITQLSETLIWGPFHDVEVSSGRAYCAMGYGLTVLDVSVPSQILLLSTFGVPGSTEGVRLQGNYAYLASGSAGLQILNVANPQAPSLVGELDSPGYSYEMDVSGSYLYLADGSGGLRVIDIADPVQPHEIASLSLGGWARDLQVDGDVLYIAAEAAGLKVVNVATPNQPQVIGEYNTTGISLGLRKIGNLLYLADGQNGVLIFNVSMPDQPQLLGQWTTGGVAHEVKVSGSYAYVADDSPGMVVLNVSNPALPYQVGVYNSAGLAWSLAITGTTLYLADDTQGLAVVLISNPQAPALAGSYSFPGEVYAVWVSGDYAYAARGYTRKVTILNVSEPSQPEFVSEFAQSRDNPAVDVLVQGNICYSSHLAAGVYLTDVSNPALPDTIEGVNTVGEAVDVVPRLPILYIADSWEGLVFIRLQPDSAWHVQTSDWAKGVTLIGNAAYVSQWSAGIAVVDITNPLQPQMAAEYNTPGLAHHCVVSGGYIYVADGYAGLTVLQGGSIIGQYNTNGSTYDVKLAGNYAFLADGSSGLLVLDVTNPASPQYAGSYRTPGTAKEIYLDGQDIYVADQYGLGVYRFESTGVTPSPDPAIPVSLKLSACPNPFNGMLFISVESPYFQPGDLTVYSITGQVVAHLYQGILTPGWNPMHWEVGTAASGIYLISLQAGESGLFRKVILQK